jgi:succinate dehydrogenase / fumarate reductase cytochrome b subunit
MKLTKALSSSVGRKIVNALSAVGLVVFVILHLAGNLTIYGGAEAFNAYGYKLHSLGWILTIAEIGLVAVFLLHIASSIAVTLENRKARSEDYVASRQSKGGPSNWSWSSVYMIVSGLFLLAFVVVHVLQFRFAELTWVAEQGGPISATTTVNGHETRNLYAFMEAVFSDWRWLLFYEASMIFLALHLRHGLWSWLQSIGAMAAGYKQVTYAAAAVTAAVVGAGFFALPLYVYFVSG